MAVPNTNDGNIGFIDRKPDYEFDQVLQIEYKTGILTSQAGGEQRSRRRAAPVFHYEYMGRSMDRFEMAKARALNTDNHNKLICCPIWWFGAVVQQQISGTRWLLNLGSGRFASQSLYKAGGYVYFEEDGIDSEFSQIVSISGQELTLDDDLDGAFTSNAKAYPCIVGMRRDHGFAVQYKNVKHGREQIAIDELPPQSEDNTIDPPASVTQLDSLDIFEVNPSNSDFPIVSGVTKTTEVKLSESKGVVYYLNEKLKHFFGMSFAFYEQGDVFDMVAFFAKQQGSYRKFYAHPWKNELPLNQNYSAAQTSILLKECFYDASFYSNSKVQLGEAFFIYNPGTDQILYRQPTSVVDAVISGNTIDTVSFAGGLEFSGSDEQSICGHLYQCRFDEDTLSLVLGANNTCMTKLGFREIIAQTTLPYTFPSSSLFELYVIIKYDTSGSMVADEAAIIAAATQVKNFLRDSVYGGDQVEADKWVKIYADSSEQWIDMLAHQEGGELSSRYFCAIYINESESVYHDVPRVPANEPTSQFNTDFGELVTEYNRRDFSAGKVWSINPSDPGWDDENAAFDAHLNAAFGGEGNYSGLSQTLASLKCSHEVDVPSGRAPIVFFYDIMSAILKELIG